MKAAVTDSPWFWAYLFGTAALVALALASPKFGPRQAQIEREYQGRQRAAQNAAGEEPTLALSSPDDTIIELRPLFWTLAAITMGAWLVFWRRHVACQTPTSAAHASPPDAEPPRPGKTP